MRLLLNAGQTYNAYWYLWMVEHIAKVKSEHLIVDVFRLNTASVDTGAASGRKVDGRITTSIFHSNRSLVHNESPTAITYHTTL